MSSGTLPYGKYHRAGALGEGTYGSVVAVYDEGGKEFALKMFDCDQNNETLELGTLRELSILRLLRESNSHPNIVEMVDIMEPGEEGDCTEGNLCMAMPMFRAGDMKRAIKTGVISPGPAGRKQRVHIAHGLLSAVAFLHDNHIIHRDIKSDNVMITLPDEENGNGGEEDIIRPVLIDFSLAKFVDGPNAVLPPGSTHTGEVGTPTYTAPEVVKKESYGLKSDMWSVGVVLLESLIGELEAEKDKTAARIIDEKKASLPESPFVNLIRGLLEPEVEKRLTAREALALPVFQKFNLEPFPVRIIETSTAIPDDEEYDEDENENKSNHNVSKKSNKPKKLTPRERLVKKLCAEIESKNPKTEAAALFYAKKMEQLDDELDNITETQTLLDCILIANKFYEQELIDIDSVAEDYPSFADFDIDTFRDNEVALCSLVDYCLYLREQ